jgi:putative ABC transport system permease protein
VLSDTPTSQLGEILGLLWHGLRGSLHDILRNPVAGAVICATVAIGVGANTTVFMFSNALLLKPLPYPDSAGLLRVDEPLGPSAERPAPMISSETYRAWVRSTRTLEGLAAYTTLRYTLSTPDQVTLVSAATVSPGLFPLLRVATAAGRLFTPQEGGAPPANQVVILAHRTWRDTFRSDPDVIGGSILLDGIAHVVVGVMPEQFSFPDRETKLWTPQYMPETVDFMAGGVFALPAVARVKQGVDIAQAEAEGTQIVRALRAQRSPRGTDTADGAIRLVPLQTELTKRVRPVLQLVSLVAALVLLVTAANLANLSLSRAIGRQREFAIRSAVGSTPGSQLGLLTVDSLVVAAFGAVGGIATALAGSRLVRALAPPDIGGATEVGLDATVALFALGVSVPAAFLAGVAPYRFTTRLDLAGVLGTGDGVTSIRGRGARHFLNGGTLAACQVAAATAALILGAVLLRSFMVLAAVSPGFQIDGVTTARVTVPPSVPGSESLATFVERIVAHVSRLPGLTAVSAVDALPLTAASAGVSFSTDDENGSPARRIHASVRSVTPDYTRVMRLRAIEGRVFHADDARAPEPVAVVNETFARMYGDRVRLLGKALALSSTSPPRVVGIVNDTRHSGLDQAPEPEIYMLFEHFNRFKFQSVYLAISTPSSELVAGNLRAAVQSAYPEAPVDDIMSMERRVAASIAHPRFQAIVVLGFGLVATALAISGVYGVVSYNTARRRREFAIRAMVGALPSDIVRLSLAEVVRPVAIGLLIGMSLGVAGVRLLTALVENVAPLDLQVLVLAPALLGVVALLACYGPIRRSGFSDPWAELKKAG